MNIGEDHTIKNETPSIKSLPVSDLNSLLRSDHESRAVEVARLLPDVETMQVHLLTRGRLNY